MEDMAIPDTVDPEPININSLKRKLKIFGRDMSAISKYPKATIRKSDANDAYFWCQTMLADNWVWSSPVNGNFTILYFLHDIDAIAFKLTFNSLD
jgi:hypothetical protein